MRHDAVPISLRWKRLTQYLPLVHLSAARYIHLSRFAKVNGFHVDVADVPGCVTSSILHPSIRCILCYRSHAARVSECWVRARIKKISIYIWIEPKRMDGDRIVVAGSGDIVGHGTDARLNDAAVGITELCKFIKCHLPYLIKIYILFGVPFLWHRHIVCGWSRSTR